MVITSVELVLILAGIIAVGFFVLSNQRVIAAPDKVKIIYEGDDLGQAVSTGNIRLVTEGWEIAVPLVENVDELDTTLLQVEVHCDDAVTSDGVEVQLDADVLLRLARRPPVVEAGVEHYAGRSRDEIAFEVQQIIESEMDAVIGGMSADDIGADRLALERELWGLEEELTKVGLHGVSLNLQRITTDDSHATTEDSHSDVEAASEPSFSNQNW